MTRYLVLAALLSSPAAGEVPVSAFGCSQTTTEAAIPAIEGEDGTFFRVQSDLRMRNVMESPVIARMAELSRVLAEGGTTLIYVTVPTKAQVMPQALPAAAADYRFDSVTAQFVYTDIIARLVEQGIKAPDLMAALGQAEPDAPAFFKTDFHWAAAGARLAASAIAKTIRAEADYADLQTAAYKTTQGPVTAQFSTMRRGLQALCVLDLPRVEDATQTTVLVADASAEADIFADGTEPQIVLVGTSFSDAPLANFAGFLSQETGLDVLNYAVTGGNQFGAITAYLISRDFAENRPRFLIWENPVYNNLAQFGPDAMEELIAAAGSSCTEPLPAEITADKTLTVDLAGLNLRAQDTVLADLGQEDGRQVDFAFNTASGIARHAVMHRDDRMLASGKFYKSLGTLWHPDLQTLSVTFDQPVTDTTSLTLCRSGKEPL